MWCCFCQKNKLTEHFVLKKADEWSRKTGNGAAPSGVPIKQKIYAENGGKSDALTHIHTHSTPAHAPSSAVTSRRG